MQMIFSGAGIGGCHFMASSAWSGLRPAAYSLSFVRAPAAIDDRAVFGRAADRVGCEPL
jgi:hypothetical protein